MAIVAIWKRVVFTVCHHIWSHNAVIVGFLSSTSRKEGRILSPWLRQGKQCFVGPENVYHYSWWGPSLVVRGHAFDDFGFLFIVSQFFVEAGGASKIRDEGLTHTLFPPNIVSNHRFLSTYSPLCPIIKGPELDDHCVCLPFSASTASRETHCSPATPMQPSCTTIKARSSTTRWDVHLLIPVSFTQS